MASPPWHNVTIVQGDTFALVLRHEQPAGGAMAPVDVSGRSYQASYRVSFDAATDVDFSVDTSRANEGIVRLTLEPEKTVGLSSGVWDVVETADGESTTLLQGEVFVRKRVTR